MAYRFNGNTFHEVAGISLFVLFIVHNILNRRWYKTIFRGKMNICRILNSDESATKLFLIICLLLEPISLERIMF